MDGLDDTENFDHCYLRRLVIAQFKTNLLLLFCLKFMVEVHSIKLIQFNEEYVSCFIVLIRNYVQQGVINVVSGRR